MTGGFLADTKIKTPFGEFDGPGIADLTENKRRCMGIYHARTFEAGTLQLYIPGRRPEDNRPEQRLSDS